MCRDRLPSFVDPQAMNRWAKRLLAFILAIMLLIPLVVIPVGGSFLITNGRIRLPERDAIVPEAVGLSVNDVEFSSSDGVTLRGWWDPGESGRAAIIFLHGLNRSRQELLKRAGESRRRGYGVLLFEYRNHGESADAYTTLGVNESLDVCAAVRFIDSVSPGREKIFWGVSLGGSTAVLGAARCGGADAVIADSAFLSFEETVSHHIRLIFGLPAFPVATLLIFLTRMRVGFDLEEGDVERAVEDLPLVPMLFIAGSEDRRMPPDRARRLYRASANPWSDVLVIEGAGHGQAFSQAPELYLDAVFSFLADAVSPVEVN